jgi:hypothetical protein
LRNWFEGKVMELENTIEQYKKDEKSSLGD